MKTSIRTPFFNLSCKISYQNVELGLSSIEKQRQGIHHSLYRYIYYSDLQKLFVQCPSEIHEETARTMARAFDSAMAEQVALQAGEVEWKSGLAKTIRHRDDEGETKEKLCSDYTIYGPGGAPFLVIEVAYSQSRAAVRMKVEAWLSMPSIKGVVEINIDESPSFRTPDAPGSRPPNLTWEEWTNQIRACPKLGPLEINNRRWAGSHTVTVTVHQKGKNLFEEVINRLILY